MIDYKKIADAVEHYSKAKFAYLEPPWLVSQESMMVTAPKNAKLFNTFAGNLVASGEQSFLEWRKHLVTLATGYPALYQCVTPCFRDEEYDEFHHMYFIKNELIGVLHPTHDTSDVPWALINFLVRTALDFFRKYDDNIQVIDAPLENSIVNLDILLNGIEVGSYGYRFDKDFSWAYGTGVAEPRLSQALKHEIHEN